MKSSAKSLTPRQYSEKHGVAYTTVLNWLNLGLIPGAQREQLPFGGYYWMIPESAPKPTLKTGPKPKSKPREKKRKS
jgi:hypothetical protein